MGDTADFIFNWKPPLLPKEIKTGNDRIEYFDGLGQGAHGFSGTDDGGIRTTLATPIYLYLLLWRREVKKMKSSADLHRTLERLYGTAIVGDKKRIEQLCRRIGLRFRGRGRPR